MVVDRVDGGVGVGEGWQPDGQGGFVLRLALLPFPLGSVDLDVVSVGSVGRRVSGIVSGYRPRRDPV